MNPNHHIDRLYISEARFVEPDGTTKLVQPALPEEHLRPGRVAYDPDKHYMKLKCPHCDVRVDFNKGSMASGGRTLNGQRPHFKKARGQDHDLACIIPRLQHEDSGSEIDDTEGYRVHLNAFLGGKGDPEHPVYHRVAGGKVEANDIRLRPKEVFVPDGDSRKTVRIYKEAVSIRNIDDLLHFIKTKDPQRIKKSLVVNNDTITPWKDFTIVTEERLKSLVRRLLNGASHPVLLPVSVYAPKDGLMVEGSAVFYQRTRGRAQFIVPHIYKDGPDTEGAFDLKGHYLVLGIPRLTFNQKSGAHILNISLKSSDYVAQIDVQHLIDESRKRSSSQISIPAP